MNDTSNSAASISPSDRTAYIIWLLVAAALIGGSFLLKSVDDRRVAIRKLDWILPETCAFYRIFGVRCPGCGLTRSFVAMSEGRLDAAWYFNPVGIFAYTFVSLQIPLAALSWYRQSSRRFSTRLSLLLRLNQLVFYALLAALLVQWLIRSLL